MDIALALQRERTDSSNKTDKLRRRYKNFNTDVQEQFEKSSRCQEAKIKSSTQATRSLDEERDAITNKSATSTLVDTQFSVVSESARLARGWPGETSEEAS